MGEQGGAPVFGLMQDWPLTVDKFIEHARHWHGAREVVSRHADGGVHRDTYATLYDRAKQLSDALLAHGIGQGDRVATLAMNGIEHMASWYAISGIGAVCHTLNPRLFDEQLIYIVNHAQDRLILADSCFGPILERILPRCPAVEKVIYLTSYAPPVELPVAVEPLDSFTANYAGACEWGAFDERLAAGLCYTSGTTGNPKGVLYSHRSNFLHALATVQPDVMNLSATDTLLMVVPMFHANAWGLTFAAPAMGSKLVLPGIRLDGASIHRLIVDEGVTVAAGVPTVWNGLLDYLDAEGLEIGPLKRVITGGSAVPERLLRRFHTRGVDVLHAWGMTEMSPLGTINFPTPEIARLPEEEQLKHRLKQGRPTFMVEMRLADDSGVSLPHDGKTAGRLQVRGPAVTRAYIGDDRSALDGEGWFDTGDIATICPLGYMQITDRAKDIIKSGGEWISSIEIESLVSMHPKVSLAAAIGVAHPKWEERPILFLKLKTGEQATEDEIIAFLTGRMAKWWLPDAVYFIEDMPLGGTGKIDKKILRDRARTIHASPSAAARPA
ncbi:MAG TPA: long-chain-fatty-acid--CoA ligase [Alphaproteobacteria bacterium]|nr:long-chain-fatty-acid--CoA ligase [Alphaproteobacteria bacterium]